MKRSTYSDTIIGDAKEISLIGSPDALRVCIGESTTKLTEDGILNLIDGLQKFLSCRVA